MSPEFDFWERSEVIPTKNEIEVVSRCIFLGEHGIYTHPSSEFTICPGEKESCNRRYSKS
ncbi:MAG: hypothetical protein VB016_04335 [Methanomassiliicoccaceae archaeon]|nr:hypothetical protein [Methanomassiliicoccaceae archaeon]